MSDLQYAMALTELRLLGNSLETTAQSMDLIGRTGMAQWLRVKKSAVDKVRCEVQEEWVNGS